MSDSHDPEGRINPRWTEAVRRDNESWARSADNAYIRELERSVATLQAKLDRAVELLRNNVLLPKCACATCATKRFEVDAFLAEIEKEKNDG